MPGLWRNNPETREGKYPIVLRRDGTPLEKRFIVMTLHDPAASAALTAYADEAEKCGYDPQHVSDMRDLAEQAHEAATTDKNADPDAGPHRKDDPIVLAWARSIGCPGA